MPAREASTADMAIVLIGVPHSPMPPPCSAKIHQIEPMPVSGPSRSSPSAAAPLMISPTNNGARSPTRPTRRPDSAAVSA